MRRTIGLVCLEKQGVPYQMAKNDNAAFHVIDATESLGHDWLSILKSAVDRSSQSEPLLTVCVLVLGSVAIAFCAFRALGQMANRISTAVQKRDFDKIRAKSRRVPARSSRPKAVSDQSGATVKRGG